VEEQALRRVSQLACRPRRQSSSQPSIASPLAANVPLPPSPSSPMNIPKRERRISLPRRSRKSARPSTAPDNAEVSHSAEASWEAPLPMSPTSDIYSQLPVSQSAPPSQLIGHLRDRTRSLRRRPPFSQPRSSSTDSALLSKSISDKLSVVSSRTQDVTDVLDDSSRKRKNIFRGILTRR